MKKRRQKKSSGDLETKLFFTGLRLFNFTGSTKKNKKPIECPIPFSPTEISDVKCGKSHAIFLKNDGTIYVVGSNGKGQLGLSNKEISELTLLKIPNNEKVISFDTHDTHSAFLTDAGKLYVCGTLNEEGSLLNSKALQDLKIPPSLELTEIFCGYKRLYMLLSNGDVYGLGNNQYGVLGTESKAKFVMEPTKVILEAPMNESILGTPTKEKTPKVVKVACGKDHTILLTTENLCYGIGSDRSGQIGLLKRKIYTVPTLIHTLATKGITNIACGYSHSVFISKSKNLFVTGKNGHGQLGLGHTRDISSATQLFPYRFAKNTTIQDAVCGTNHSFFMSPSRLYGCGKNSNGQIGVGSFHKPYQPCEVLNSTGVMRVFAGGDYTFIMRKVKGKGEGKKKIGKTTGKKKIGKRRPSKSVKNKTIHFGKSPINSGKFKKNVEEKSASQEELNEAKGRIAMLEEMNESLKDKVRVLSTENEILKGKLDSAKITEEDRFQNRVRKLIAALNLNIEVQMKNRDFEKCLEFQTIINQLKTVTLNEESEKLVTTLEQANFFIK